MSKEGQQIYREADYMPLDPEVPIKELLLRPNETTYRAVNFTPEQINDNMPNWMVVFKDIFR